jgi:DNA repair protein RadC
MHPANGLTNQADGRPRERMAASGTRGLSDTELTTVLVGSGVKGRSVHDVAAVEEVDTYMCLSLKNTLQRLSG